MEHGEELGDSYVEAASEGLWWQDKVLSLYKINSEDKVSFGRYILSVNGSQSSVLIYYFLLEIKIVVSWVMSFCRIMTLEDNSVVLFSLLIF